MDVIKMLVTNKKTFHARDVTAQKLNPEFMRGSWKISCSKKTAHDECPLWLVKHLQHCSD